MRYDGRFASHAPPERPDDPQPGRDEQLGRIFSNMRLSLKASRELIARRLAVAVSTVDSLEAGAVTAFPHWPETERIVRTYCELLRLDPEPMLWRIRGHLTALAEAARARAPSVPLAAPALPPEPNAPRGPRGQARTPPARASAPAEPTPRRGQRSGRALLGLGVPLAIAAVLAAVVVVSSELAPGPVYRGIALLPDVLRAPIRAGFDQLILLLAAQRDGLRWVDVGDPRARKTDKLEPGAR